MFLASSERARAKPALAGGSHLRSACWRLPEGAWFGEAKNGDPRRLLPAHAHNLERIDQLRPRQHPCRARAGDGASARQSDVQFKMLHRECLTPIKQKRWCPVHDVEVGPDEIVAAGRSRRGSSSRSRMPSSRRSRATTRRVSIEITRFVSRARSTRSTSTVRTTSCRRRRRRSGGPYALLLAAMREAGWRRLGSFVLGGQGEALPDPAKGDALALETLFVAEDVKSQAEIDEAVAATGCRRQELELARQIIGVSRRRSNPRSCGASTARRSRRLLEAKLDGPASSRCPSRAGRDARSIDLMEALRASVAARRRRHERADASRAKTARRRSAPPPAGCESLSRTGSATFLVLLAGSDVQRLARCAWNSVLSILPW